MRQTDIVLQPGLLAYFQDALKRVRQDPAHGLDTAPGVRYHYPGPEGQTRYRYDTGWLEVGTGPTSSRISVAAEVATPGGIVEVRAVTPARLSDVDVAALEVTQAATITTFWDMLNRIPPDAPIYRTDIAPLVGPEPAASLPAPIPADARVSFRIARTTGDPNSPGPVSSEGRTWSLVDRAGTGAGSVGVGGPSGASGGSVAGQGVSHGQVVLVTVCSSDSQQPQQSEDCG